MVSALGTAAGGACVNEHAHKAAPTQDLSSSAGSNFVLHLWLQRLAKQLSHQRGAQTEEMSDGVRESGNDCPTALKLDQRQSHNCAQFVWGCGVMVFGEILKADTLLLLPHLEMAA